MSLAAAVWRYFQLSQAASCPLGDTAVQVAISGFLYQHGAFLIGAGKVQLYRCIAEKRDI